MGWPKVFFKHQQSHLLKEVRAVGANVGLNSNAALERTFKGSKAPTGVSFGRIACSCNCP